MVGNESDTVEVRSDAASIDALFPSLTSPSQRAELGIDEDRLDDALGDFGVYVESRQPVLPPGQMGLVVLQRYVCVKRLRWTLLTAAVKILFDQLAVGQVAPSTAIDALASLGRQIVKLEPGHQLIVGRVLDQQRGTGCATRETLEVGLDPAERSTLNDGVAELIESGVIQESEAGCLSVPF